MFSPRTASTPHVIAQRHFTEMGVQVRITPTAGTSVGERLDGEKLLCLQSPSNPGLHVCDIAEPTTQAHTAGALVTVNNTTPMILGQNRLLWAQTFPLPQTGKR